MVHAKDLCDLILDIVTRSRQSLELIDEDTISHKPSGDRWSNKEMIGHLIDSAINNHRRFKAYLHQSHLVFDGYHQDEEVILHDYQNREWSSITALYFGMNEQIAALLLSLGDVKINEWHSQHNYDRIGFQRIISTDSTTLAYLILDYISHMEHHLSQVLPDYQRIISAYSNEPLQYHLSS